MAITVKSVSTNKLSNGTGPNTISVTTPSASVGDLLVIIVSNDFYTQAAIGLDSITPTATATNITNFDSDAGSNKPHIKGWWAPVTTAGAVTVVGNTGHPDEEKALVVYILSGADTTAPIDDSAHTSTVTNSSSLIAPSVSPAGTTDLLISYIQTDGSNSNPTATAPGGMSNTYSLDEGGVAQAFGGSELLSASGATGTRTWAYASTTGYISATLAIKTATGGGGGGSDSAVTAWLTA